jgi:methionyl aminopeptidase
LDSVEVLNPSLIERMRESCSLAADTLVMIGPKIRAGLTTDDLNKMVHDYTIEHHAWPSSLNYHGFPKSVCTSVNEVICHGIPGQYRLKNGDIVNVDITTYFPAKNGFHGDTSATFYVGEPSQDAIHVVEVSRHCLELGIAEVREGARVGDIGAAIQEYAEGEGCSVVRDFVGHGIGRQYHAAPQIPHFGRRDSGKRLKAGMTFTVEPMINLGGYECEVMADGWTVKTRDRSLSAQFEHTILVTQEGCEVLTARKQLLANSEDKSWSKLGRLSCPAAFVS